MKYPQFSLFIFSLLLSATFLFGQKASQREQDIFRRGLQDYQSGLFAKAAQNFQLVIQRLPNTQLLTANYLMLAKSQYQLQKYDSALETCDIFIHKFKQSAYIDDIYLCMGNSFFKKGKHKNAIDTWLKAVTRANNEQLRRKALNYVELVVRLRLDFSAANALLHATDDPYSKSALRFALAQKYLDVNDIGNAINHADQLLADSSTPKYYQNRSKTLKLNISNPETGKINIAALLPLTGPSENVGNALLDGAKLAVKEYNKSAATKLDLKVYDYQGRITTAVKLMKQIANHPSISAVFGPLENDITAAVSAISEYEDIAVITPTATDGELLNLSDGIFQLNAPLSKTGAYLARYAANSLKAKRCVTISPIDDYFNRLTDAFTKEAQKQNIEIVAQEWYYPGDKDIAAQFKRIKRIGLKLLFSDSLRLDNPEISQEEIDAQYQLYMKMEKERVITEGVKVDSADIAVTTIDCIFMPIYQEDIHFMAPQFAYNNIQAKLLGNEDWYDKKMLKKNRNYINGLIFSSHLKPDEQSSAYKTFRNRFRIEYKRHPEKYELVGYDSFKFILNAISEKKGFNNRAQFKELLKNSSEYNGVYKTFEVGANRYNESIRLLEYRHGRLYEIN
jgi:ABC-type branched-subunit amino acid transport system substrate-binding protein